jgi:hypothetical protein
MNGNIYIILFFKCLPLLSENLNVFIKVDFSSKMHMTQWFPGFFVEKIIWTSLHLFFNCSISLLFQNSMSSNKDLLLNIRWSIVGKQNITCSSFSNLCNDQHTTTKFIKTVDIMFHYYRFYIASGKKHMHCLD